MHRSATLLSLVLAGAVPAAAAEPYAWPDLERLFAAALAEVGPPLRIFSLELASDGDAELLVQRNERPDLVDRFALADGTLQGPDPVKFDEYPSQLALDYHAIEAGEIDLARLPAMLEATRARLKMPDGAVARITLERGDSDGVLSYQGVPIWEFHLENARHDGYVQFDPHGKVLHVDKD
jgi:hypothetical protein